jgi:magnesium-transporting ATPase (P-type)
MTAPRGVRRSACVPVSTGVEQRLSAIQNFGAMDVLCTDKTGTLTQDKVVLLMHLDVNGENDERVFEYAFLNSYFQTGLKNLLDKAVLEHEDLIVPLLTDCYLKYDEIHFDFDRRRMSVIVHEILRGRDLLICKEAVEEVLSVCRSVRIEDRIFPLNEEIRARVIDLSTRMNEDGLRVIAVACKEVESRPDRQYGVTDEGDMILCGFIVFLDPPRESAAPAIAALRTHGVAVKVLTGDNELVARKVCRDVGLDGAGFLLGDIGRFMLCIGPISSIFDLTTFAVMWYVFGASTVERQSLFQTGWFVEGLLSQTLIIHMIRTAKVPFIQSRAAAPLMLLSLAVMAAGIAIPYTRLGEAVGMVPLPAAFFPWLAATLVGYSMLTQIVKRLFLRRYGSWL